MQTITLCFLHPSEQTYLPIVAELKVPLYQIAESVIHTGFVETNPNGYHLAIGNQVLTADYTALDLNLTDQTMIRIVLNPARKPNSVNFGNGKKAAMNNALATQQNEDNLKLPKTETYNTFWQLFKSLISK
jgi:hypothetical protein